MLPVSSDPAGWQAAFSGDAIECVPIGTITPSPEIGSLYGVVDTKNIDLINLATDIQANGIRDHDLKIPHQPEISRVKSQSAISERKRPMLEAARRVILDLSPFWPLSVRQIHYRLLDDPPLRSDANGKQRARCENNRASYQDLRDLLIRARLLNEELEEKQSDAVELQATRDYVTETLDDFDF